MGTQKNQSLAFYLFSPTRLVNSIKLEHSCKILYICNKGSTHVRSSICITGCIVIAALANNVLGGDPTPEGATGPWCWIAEDVHDSTMWMVITGKGWEIFCYLITATAVLFILTKLKLVRCFVCFFTHLQ